MQKPANDDGDGTNDVDPHDLQEALIMSMGVGCQKSSRPNPSSFRNETQTTSDGVGDVDPDELQEALVASLRDSSCRTNPFASTSFTSDEIQRTNNEDGDVDRQEPQEALDTSQRHSGRSHPIATATDHGNTQKTPTNDDDDDDVELQKALITSMGVGTMANFSNTVNDSMPRAAEGDDDADQPELQEALAESLMVDSHAPPTTDIVAPTPSDDQNLDLQAALFASSLEDQNRRLSEAEALAEEARMELCARPHRQNYEKAYQRYKCALNVFVEYKQQTRATEILHEMGDLFYRGMWGSWDERSLLDDLDGLLLFAQRYDMAIQCYRRADDLYRSEDSLESMSRSNDAINRLEDLVHSCGLTEWGMNCLRAIDSSNVLSRLEDATHLFQNGFAEEALQAHWSLLSWCHEQQLTLLLPQLHFRFAYLLQATEAYDEALSHYVQVCDLLPKAGLCFNGHPRYMLEGDQSMLFARANHFLGTIWQSKGDPRRSLEYYDIALRIKERAGTIERVVTCNNIASVYMDWASRTKHQNLERNTESYLRQAEETLNLLMEKGGEHSVPPWHPEMIYCKYNLALIALKGENYEEALELADYIIAHLPKYKWAYTVKAEALVKMNLLDEALSVCDVVLGLAPNYADAVKARLQLLMEKKKAIVAEQQQEQSEGRTPSWEAFEELDLLDAMISSSLQSARELRLDAGDEVDQLVVNDFQSATTSNGSNAVNPLGAEAQVPMSQITDLDTIMNLIQEISTKQDQTLQGIGAIHQQTQNIERKTEEVLAAQRQQTEAILEIRAGQDKSQAVLSYLIDGENLPCPKLVLLVPKTKNRFFSIRRFVNEPFRPFKRKWEVFFPCERTLKIANPQTPMEIYLTVGWLKQLAPLVKASLVALNIACRIGGLPLPSPLPFPDMGLMDNISEFQGMVRDHCALDEHSFELLCKLEEWAEDREHAVSLTDSDINTQMKRLTDSSYRSFSELALQNRECWSPFMERVVHRGRLMWVAKTT